ncbi:MAG: phosphate ABC transporter permease subunit PstC [Actinobacteria bacterium]|nr:phosphate ABC transporter permease subunit PstC [Actinomycetota bacterium]
MNGIEETNSLPPEANSLVNKDVAIDFASAVSAPKSLFNWRDVKERLIYYTLLGCVLISVLTTIGIIVLLLSESFSFFKEVPLRQFLTDTQWTPLSADQHFGIMPLVAGTSIILLGSSIVALPVGLASAIYLSMYADQRVRKVVKPLLEVLAGIPTVVYGYFALTFVTPILKTFIPDLSIFNALSASIVVGIMIIPMVSSLSEDALTSVPRSLKEAGFALGATHHEVATKIVLPAGLSGVIASFILAISRAIGETMIVTLAAGSTPKLTLNPLESIQTMTASIVSISIGDTPQGTIEYKTIFAVGMMLFIITLLINMIGQVITRRFREVYE